MSWTIARRQIGRVAVLALMVVAIMGPWAFTLDGVPPPEWCREPLFLLDNGRCAGLVSGATIASFMAMAFVMTIASVISGALTLPENSRELVGLPLFMLCVLLVLLPFLNTLLSVLGQPSRRSRVFQLVAWGVAGALSLLMVVFDTKLLSTRFWGLWLYIALAAGAFVMQARAIKDEG